jgi:hypothetical protein
MPAGADTPAARALTVLDTSVRSIEAHSVRVASTAVKSPMGEALWPPDWGKARSALFAKRTSGRSPGDREVPPDKWVGFVRDLLTSVRTTTLAGSDGKRDAGSQARARSEHRVRHLFAAA